MDKTGAGQVNRMWLTANDPDGQSQGKRSNTKPKPKPKDDLFVDRSLVRASGLEHVAMISRFAILKLTLMVCSDAKPRMLADWDDIAMLLRK